MFDQRALKILQDYYPKLEEMINKLAELSYGSQELSVSFPVGKINIIINRIEFCENEYKL